MLTFEVLDWIPQTTHYNWLKSDYIYNVLTAHFSAICNAWYQINMFDSCLCVAVISSFTIYLMKQKYFLKIRTNCRDLGHWDSITEFRTILIKSRHLDSLCI